MELEFIDDLPEEDDMNIYDTKMREDALDEDEIADWEEAFMQGWDEAIAQAQFVKHMNLFEVVYYMNLFSI